VTSTVDVAFVLRGRVVEDPVVEHRAGDLVFRTPDPHALLGELPLTSRVGMADLHAITIDEIVDFLAEVGDRLRLSANAHLQAALSVTARASNLTDAVVESVYEHQLVRFFRRERMLEAIDRRIGRAYLEGWVDETDADGRNVRVRAFGARTTHVVAGNSPGVTAQTVVRNALTRGDAIIKTPANDPVTAVAILRTMVDVDPDHPVTRHVSALHWRGGDARVEQVALSSPNIDKIVAWGGSAAIEHAASYVGPGVELIALDPKISIALLGTDVVTDPATGAEAARRLAIDVGTMNQEACVNARIAYVDVEGLDDPAPAIRELASMVFEALQQLPASVSTPVDHLPAELRDEVETALLLGEPEVVGGGTGAGGVLVSWDGRPVDFSASLAARYVNLVPVHGFDGVLERVSSTTQTCGVFPAALRERLRDPLALAGVQRIATLGTAAGGGDHQAIPQDGIEVLRRMCRWIVDEADRTRGPDDSEPRTLDSDH
jgi:hypothetical protein